MIDNLDICGYIMIEQSNEIKGKSKFCIRN